MARNVWLAGAAAVLALGACRERERPPEPAPQTPAAPAAPAQPAPAEAAKAIVGDYAALLESGDRAGAAGLWLDPADAAQFAATLEDYPEVKMAAGTPAAGAGAASPERVTVPLDLNLTLRSGSPYEMTCEAIVERGGAADRKRWRIRSIDC